MWIDLYCERTGPGLWDEPFNAVSNLAFVVAAVLAYRVRRARGHGDVWELLLIVLAAGIGIGSFLFHTVAQPWSQLIDIVPIWGFVVGYVLLVIYRLFGVSRVYLASLPVFALVIVLGYRWGASGGASVSPVQQSLVLNGSLDYLPAIIALVVFTALAWRRQSAMRTVFLAATILFAVALAFRTIDIVACESTNGIGTHFVWHLLNAVMIGLLLQAMCTRMPPPIERL